MENAYTYVIILLHLGFAASLALMQWRKPSRSIQLFAWSWVIEAVRAAILLPAVHDLGGWPAGWFGLAEVLCLFANWLLFSACAGLVGARFPRWLVPVYLGASVPLVLLGRFAVPVILRDGYGWTLAEGQFYGVLGNLVVLFVPVTATRLVILIWLYKLWRRTQLAGALLAALFCVPYAVIALLVPFEFYFSYNPAWVSLLWVFRVFGFSMGVLLLLISRQEDKLSQSEGHLRAILDSVPESVAVLAADGTLLEMNPAGLKLLEADTFAQVANQSLEGMMAEEYHANFRELIAAAGRGEAGATEFPITGMKGGRRWLETQTTALRDERGRVTSVLAISRDVTAQKKAEAEIQKSFSTLLFFIDTVPHFIAFVDAEERYQLVNLRYEEWFGRPRALILGRRLQEIHRPATYEAMQPHLREVLAGRPAQYENRMTGRDGGKYCFDVRLVPRRAPDGRVLGYFVLALDVSERKQAEEELARERTLLRTMFDLLPDYIYLKDEQSRFMVCNNRRAGDNASTITVEELMGKTDADFFPPEQAAQFRADELAVLGGAPLIDKEETLRRPDGTEQVILTTKLPFRDGSGKITGLVGYGRDITERKRAERHIQQLNRVYSVLSDINQTIVREKDQSVMLAAACQIAVEKGRFRMAWIGLFDPATQTLECVAASGVVEGYPELAKIDLREHPATTRPAVRCLLNGEHAVCNDIQNEPLDLPWREEMLKRGYHSAGAFPLKLEGQIAGVFSLYAGDAGCFDAEELRLLDELASDISFAMEVSRNEVARRQAETELRWRTAFFEAQVDSALDGIWVVDNQGRKILQNQRMNDLWKIPAAITENKDEAAQLEFIIHRTKNPTAFAEKIAHLNAHPDEVSREEIELVDGTILERYSSPVRDKAGNYYGRIWTFRDRTERRQLEAQFRQAQKMEAVGQLAGGVAHDFNNILAAITMQVYLAMTGPEVPGETQALLEDIQAATERAASLTRQLLAFSRRQVLQTRQLDLNESVTSLTKMLHRILGEDVRLQLDLHPGALWVLADAGMLDQVLLNLVVNARDAMPAGGRLTIETTEKTLTEPDVAAIPDAVPGRYVCLQVRDTGCGMTPEIMSHIFEPFFTTKEQGKGTGLGLATVFGIVKQHGGAITVESQAGNGTTFQIFLRAEAAAENSGAGEGDRAEPRGGTETILLVEDDEAFRTATQIVLERAGYRILVARDGVEALRVWEEKPVEIRLLLTDMVMPEGVSGHELAARLQVRNPRLKVIFSSGYSGETAGRELALEEGQNFIQKPYTARQLMEVIRRCLDQ